MSFFAACSPIAGAPRRRSCSARRSSPAAARAAPRAPTACCWRCSASRVSATARSTRVDDGGDVVVSAAPARHGGRAQAGRPALRRHARGRADARAGAAPGLALGDRRRRAADRRVRRAPASVYRDPPGERRCAAPRASAGRSPRCCARATSGSSPAPRSCSPRCRRSGWRSSRSTSGRGRARAARRHRYLALAQAGGVLDASLSACSPTARSAAGGARPSSSPAAAPPLLARHRLHRPGRGGVAPDPARARVRLFRHRLERRAAHAHGEIAGPRSAGTAVGLGLAISSLGVTLGRRCSAPA